VQWESKAGPGRPRKVQEEFPTGAVRDSRKDKGRYDLLPWSVLRLLSERFEEGAKRYGERNWEKGQPLSRYLDSCLRHLFQHLEGRTDEKHGVAALWNLCALIWTEDAIEKNILPKILDDLKKKSPPKRIRKR
jgi:Domain of unknown function (DUF5664)